MTDSSLAFTPPTGLCYLATKVLSLLPQLVSDVSRGHGGFYLHSSPLPPSNRYLLSQITMVAKNLVDWGACFEWHNCTTSRGHRHCSPNLCQGPSKPCSRTSKPQDVSLHYFNLVKLLDAAIFILDPGFKSVEAVLLVLKLKDNMYHKLLSHFLLFFLHTIFHTPFI